MRGPAFYRATIGKKVVMAVTGIILVGWILGHVLGNLLVFRGPAALNEYAALLKSNAALLWAMRAGLLVTVVLHVVAAIQLVRQEAASRPARYTKKVPQESTFASRTIRWGGLIIAVFVVCMISAVKTLLDKATIKFQWPGLDVVSPSGKPATLTQFTCSGWPAMF